MQQLIYFFQKFKYFLFFLLLQFIALAITFNNLSFQKSKFINSANAVSGGIYSQVSNISDYFNLKSENELLLEENTRLRNQLDFKNNSSLDKDSVVIDSTLYFQKYTFLNAKIIKNSYANAFNFLTINKGKKQGVDREMAVINSKGIIGITDNSTSNYTRVQSILNKNSSINARLKNERYFGSLKWNGENYNIVQLTDIPRQAPIKVGDTIETGGRSAIFPEGILIGSVIKVNNTNTVNNTIDVQLFNDMSNLGAVYVIKNLHKLELQTLENTVNE
ncbi:rod shape-determining protein MreC [Polaribacter sp.]|uniref:rod shape-determining protein MreC n=1 Tax=Polaribacter sp. TaxID=1920175 RepID=UPI003F6C94D3